MSEALSLGLCPRCREPFVRSWSSRQMTGYGPGEATLRLVCAQGHAFEARAVEEGESWRLCPGVTEAKTA